MSRDLGKKVAPAVEEQEEQEIQLRKEIEGFLRGVEANEYRDEFIDSFLIDLPKKESVEFAHAIAKPEAGIETAKYWDDLGRYIPDIRGLAYIVFALRCCKKNSYAEALLKKEYVTQLIEGSSDDLDDGKLFNAVAAGLITKAAVPAPAAPAPAAPAPAPAAPAPVVPVPAVLVLKLDTSAFNLDSFSAALFSSPDGPAATGGEARRWQFLDRRAQDRRAQVKDRRHTDRESSSPMVPPPPSRT